MTLTQTTQFLLASQELYNLYNMGRKEDSHHDLNHACARNANKLVLLSHSTSHAFGPHLSPDPVAVYLDLEGGRCVVHDALRADDVLAGGGWVRPATGGEAQQRGGA